MPAVSLGFLWTCLVWLNNATGRRPLRTVAIGLAIASILWVCSFSIGVYGNYQESWIHYENQIRRKNHCQSNNETFQLFHEECTASETKVSVPLLNQVLLETWSKSSVCGQTSCVSILMSLGGIVIVAVAIVVTVILIFDFLAFLRRWMFVSEVRRYTTRQAPSDALEWPASVIGAPSKHPNLHKA